MIYSIEDRKPEFRGSEYFIADNATVIGSVILEQNASIWFNTVVRGDNDVITIGENTNVQDGSILHTDPGIKLTLGREVTVGHMAMLHGCTVGDNSLIGIKAVILNGVQIGRNCIVGAGTLIPEGKVIPDGSMVLGTPGRIVRQIQPQEVQMIRVLADHYVQNFKRYVKILKKAGKD